MNATCGCTPGTFENGWHESRSDECRRLETEAFARAIDAVRSAGFLRQVVTS